MWTRLRKLVLHFHTHLFLRQQTPEEELCNLLTNIVFSVLWSGSGAEGSGDAVWRERGQVFSVLTKLGSSCQLVRPPDEIKRRCVMQNLTWDPVLINNAMLGSAMLNVFLLFAHDSLLEMMLESSLSDLRDAQGVSLPFCPSLVRLLRLLQDFLFAEGTDNRTLWSEKVAFVQVSMFRMGFTWSLSWHQIAKSTWCHLNLMSNLVCGKIVLQCDLKMQCFTLNWLMNKLIFGPISFLLWVRLVWLGVFSLNKLSQNVNCSYSG